MQLVAGMAGCVWEAWSSLLQQLAWARFAHWAQRARDRGR